MLQVRWSLPSLRPILARKNIAPVWEKNSGPQMGRSALQPFRHRRLHKINRLRSQTAQSCRKSLRVAEVGLGPMRTYFSCGCPVETFGLASDWNSAPGSLAEGRRIKASTRRRVRSESLKNMRQRDRSNTTVMLRASSLSNSTPQSTRPADGVHSSLQHGFRNPRISFSAALGPFQPSTAGSLGDDSFV